MTRAFRGLGVAFYFVVVGCAPQPVNIAPASAMPDAPPPPQAQTAPIAPKVDHAQLAHRLVSQSAAVKADEVVLIRGAARDLALLERLAIEVRKVGAHPIIALASERVNRAYYAEVDARYDTQPARADAGLARLADVVIEVEAGESEGLFADVPPARLAAVGKTFEPIAALTRKRKTRMVYVGNDLYPTAWRAKHHGIPEAQFASLFWDSLNIDYTALQASGGALGKAFAGGELRITHPNGTDLTLSIKGRPVLISDGIITAADVARGALEAFLPAGELMIAPAAGTGTGRFIIEKTYFSGREVTKLALRFEKGKLVEMSGEGPGYVLLKADYEARGPGKERLGYFDLGINPSYALGSTHPLGNWISAGMVSVGTGFNLWAGGDNAVSAGVGGHLGGCTVTVDGRTVVDKGTLKP